MGKYTNLADSLYDEHTKKYKKPVVEDYIVGFTGIDPDEKVNSEAINHEDLNGLLGGNLTGHYHLTIEQVAQLREFQRAINDINRIIDTTIANLDARIESTEEKQRVTEEKVTAAIADFHNTEQFLNNRMEAIAGQATEDIEILDARVDSNGVIHSNLGQNIRNIHDLLLDYMNYESAYREARDNDLQAQADELSAAILNELCKLSQGLQSSQLDLSSIIEDYRERELNLYRQIDEVSCAALNEMYRHFDEVREYRLAIEQEQEARNAQIQSVLTEINNNSSKLADLTELYYRYIVKHEQLQDEVNNIKTRIDDGEPFSDDEIASDDDVLEMLEDALGTNP